MPKIAEIVLEPGPFDPFWLTLKQVGVDAVVGVMPGSGGWEWEKKVELPWDFGPLNDYKQQLADCELEMPAFEDAPPMENIRLGRPGRDEEIEHFQTFVRNLGRLEIHTLTYDWWAGLGWQRNRFRIRERGGLTVSGFDASAQVGAPMTRLGRVEARDLWANLEYFLERVLPVAEDAGVRLAMHPDDPPLPTVRGIDRIMSSPENYERLLDFSDSPANGITLCQGNFALMTDDVPALIRNIGSSGRVYFVHFRDVRGTAENFKETPHDAGPTDLLECLRAYRDVGFDGYLRTDHVPTLEGDTAPVIGYSQRARLHAIGYVQGLIHAVDAEAK
jgi:mannonate dehydratase